MPIDVSQLLLCDDVLWSLAEMRRNHERKKKIETSSSSCVCARKREREREREIQREEDNKRIRRTESSKKRLLPALL